MHYKRLFLAAICVLAMWRLAAPACADPIPVGNPGIGGAGSPFLSYKTSEGTLEAQAIDHDGNVVVTGNLSHTATGFDYATLKKDSTTGAILWETEYNGRGNGFDIAYAVAVDSHNNVFVTGYSYGGITLGYEFVTIKYDGATGAPLWTHHWSGVGTGDHIELAVDSHDDVFVVGDINSGVAGSGKVILILKYRGTDGTLLWLHHYGDTGANGSDARAIAIDSHDNLCVTGSDRNGVNFLTLKYDGATGNLLWTSRWNEMGGNNSSAVSIAIDHADNIVVAGSLDRSPWFGNTYTTEKIEGATGKVLWVRHLDGIGAMLMTGDDLATDVKVDSQDNIVVTGLVWIDYTPGYNVYYQQYEITTLKYDTSGTSLWTNLFLGKFPRQLIDDRPSKTRFILAIDSADNVIVAGDCDDYYRSSSVSSDTPNLMTTLKISGATSVGLWAYVYSDPDKRYNYVSAIGTDSSNHVYVAGGGFDVGYITRWTVLKYLP